MKTLQALTLLLILGASKSVFASVKADDTWETYDVVVESDHPYGESLNETREIAFVGAKAIKLHFALIDTESSYDVVSIADGDENVLNSWDGQADPFWTQEVPGDRMYLKFVSDNGTSGQGYIVDQIAVLKPNLKVNRVVKIKEIAGASGVDLLWVIDNSATMRGPQEAVIANAESFMNEFVKSGIDWKLGLISTDRSEAPFIGFGANPFNFRTPDPTSVFSDAVSKLGREGSGTEETFIPILKHLKDYSDFSRPGIPLAVVMVTDAGEQSQMDAQNFLTQFKTLIGPDKNFYAYGVFAATDLGCQPGEAEEEWNYEGSPFEGFVKTAKIGRAYPMCSADYGKTFAEVGREITQSLSRSAITLSSRPNPATISVKFKGTDLPGGSQESGGYWYYDTSSNAVVFYSLDFSSAADDVVSLSYDKFVETMEPSLR